MSPYITDEDGNELINPEYFRDKSILICTPCYGGSMNVNYFQSCIKLMSIAQQVGLQLSFFTIANESLITRARNTCVAQLLSRPEFTHLLFIDADIGFDPTDVLRLIAANRGVVAGSYAMKALNWSRVAEVAAAGQTDFQEAASYNVVNFKEGAKPDPYGIVEVKEAGTGFMLIKRRVIERLVEACPELAYESDGLEGGETFALFDTRIVDGRYLSEDYSFCQLWQALGGSIYVAQNAQLSHYGTYEFT